MTPGAYAIIVVLCMVIIALFKANNDLRADRDRWFTQAGRLTCRNIRLRRQRNRARRAASDNLTSLLVVLDAHARDIVQDPLGTDLMPDESLTLVKGGRR